MIFQYETSSYYVWEEKVIFISFKGKFSVSFIMYELHKEKKIAFA